MATLLLSGYLRAKRLEKARVLLERLGEAIACDLTAASVERYWRDPALFRFVATVDLGQLSFRDAYFEVPARFASLSGRWSMTVPYSPTEGSSWDFEADTARTSIAGVESVCFHVRADARPPDR